MHSFFHDRDTGTSLFILSSNLQNLLAGALFGTWIGFPLACTLTAFGATNCYLMSKYFGMDYILKYFPNRIKPVQQKVCPTTFFLNTRHVYDNSISQISTLSLLQFI